MLLKRSVGIFAFLASEPVPGENIEPKTLRMDLQAQRRMQEFAAWIEPRLAESGELGNMTD
jgi:hypothetical protein